MYASYFGLTQEPFSIAPDPRYLFMSERHREALAHLLYGLSGGGGFVLLTGGIGTGKTTVCRCFLEQVPSTCNVAYIFNPKLTVTELLQAVCEEFHVLVAQKDLLPPTVKDYLDPLNAFLLAEHAAGRNNVLIIDEAQNLSAEVLEQLRLLTNLETSERKLLQIILIGQPELRTLLARPELEQLSQRVIARFHLDALTEAETAHYVRHRLEVAGLQRAMPFERHALRRVHALARGVPRRINLLCDRALLGAFSQGRASVSPAIVERAAGEVFHRPPPAGRNWRQAAAVLGLGAIAGGAVLLAARALEPARPLPAPVAAVALPPLPVAPAPAARVPATAASAPESTAAAETAPAVPPAAGPPVLLADADAAWRELAQVWGASVAQGPACRQLAREQLQCFSRPTSLALIRQLGRPGVVTLDANTGAPSYAVLAGLTAQTATLRAGGTEQTVTLAALAARWQGEFATLWRAPAGYGSRRADGDSGPTVAWVREQLARLDGAAPPAGRAVMDNALRARLRSFQLAQGLPVDGLPGPMTFMQLNRVAGIDEPRLRTEP